ncbi:methyl-accepting chemotaxis protein [Sporosarcina sp. ACRSL]|uniref:methyl-accepting chemotaxis protein n=1 Tax=Sporosarcina sp. ACRSL TaxID=2918215 RepID=UPI001EF6AC32|nr:methyl-accepting chemotaxis protein [Sporosarcina sp. ACRSL]MCG7343782.1 methyl-accepting chemotaxis protein [Sporosarcina sp. ACRSL]
MFKSIKGKLLFSFSLVILLVLLYGIYNISVVIKSNNEARSIVEKELPLLIAHEKMALTMANRISTARGYVLYGGDFKERFNEYSAQGIQNEQIIREIQETDEFDQLIEKTVAWRTYITEEVFAEYDRGNREAAMRKLDEVTPMVRELMAGYEQLADRYESNIESAQDKIITGGELTLKIVSIVTVLVILFSVGAALFTANQITKPIKLVMNRMLEMAKGDLSGEELKTNAKDEVGQLLYATNEMSDNTRKLLNTINSISSSVSAQSEELTQSANEVTVASEQIAMTMHDLAEGAESQATQAGHLSDMMDSFVHRVEEADEKGGHIQAASTKILDLTSEGRRLMDLSNEQMGRIDKIVQSSVEKIQGLDAQSQEISKLVVVIKDIADQTNLLALNAAIEAARAGEHGKGFAVVAEEVRNLAEQVSLSVTDITKIVDDIQSESSSVAGSLLEGYGEVEKGTEQITRTSRTFNDINEAVTEVAAHISTISSNLSEMVSSSQEMRGSVEEIAAITEETSAGVEQTSASAQQTNSSMEEVAMSSEQLSKYAEELNRNVLQFKL